MVNIAELFPGKVRILVVDDDSDLRLTLCEYLESSNFNVLSARDGSEAIHLLQSQRSNFDIIFTDLVMPSGPDGVEVLEGEASSPSGAVPSITSPSRSNSLKSTLS